MEDLWMVQISALSKEEAEYVEEFLLNWKLPGNPTVLRDTEAKEILAADPEIPGEVVEDLYPEDEENE